jgi:hypothetical protein
MLHAVFVQGAAQSLWRRASARDAEELYEERDRRLETGIPSERLT